jgi:predicted HTH domain antitoxin
VARNFSEISSVFTAQSHEHRIYAQELLSFGKARELANLDHWQFSQLLGVGRRPVFDQRNIPRHYSENELAEDLDYARCH